MPERGEAEAPAELVADAVDLFDMGTEAPPGGAGVATVETAVFEVAECHRDRVVNSIWA